MLNLAVRLGKGIAQNHGFVDGNKRTGASAMLSFLALNGYFLDMPNDTTLGALFESTVAGRMTEADLADDLYPYIDAI
ncbi:MAG: hypothetical protein NVS3B5_09160 [Sphingomicrobium sp.]